MNFLYPGFLFALISVAIPVIIHLFNFRKFKKVYFSNVQLLKEIEQQHASREKLKNILILLSRIFALIFLVLAFAQPFIPLKNQHATSGLNYAVSIYVDNSYSMGAVNKDGTLLDEARRKARELVKNFGINDRFQLLTNDFEGKQQRLLSAEAFLNALDEVKISSATRTVQQVLNRQASILTGNANKYSIIISDFQKNMASGQAHLQVQNDVQYTFLKIRASNLPNIAIDSVYLLSASHQPNNKEQLVVQLKNYGQEDAKNIPLKLSINNQQKGLGSIHIPAGELVRDTLSFSGLKAGWQKAAVSIKDFPLTFDDTLAFSFKVEQSLPVLSINGLNSGPYFKALFAADRYYRLSEVSEGNINYSNFSNYGLIILNELSNPSTGLAQQLRNYVHAGGSVVLFPSLNADIGVYNAFLASLNLPKIEALQTAPEKVDRIELQHPIFKTVFEEIPKNLDLPAVNRYFTFAERSTLSKEQLMQLPGPKLFFARYGLGNGQIYLSATGLSTADGNFSRHPVFLPLMYRIALSTGQSASSLYTLIGGDNVLNSNKINLGKNQTLKLTGNGYEIIPEVRQTAGKTQLFISDQVKKTGFYSLKLADSLLAVYSFNTNRSESDMRYLNDSELKNSIGKSNIKLVDAEKEPTKLISGNHKIGQTLWKLCLILSLVFIATEIFLIRFFNNPKSKHESPN